MLVLVSTEGTMKASQQLDFHPTEEWNDVAFCTMLKNTFFMCFKCWVTGIFGLHCGSHLPKKARKPWFIWYNIAYTLPSIACMSWDGWASTHLQQRRTMTPPRTQSSLARRGEPGYTRRKKTDIKRRIVFSLRINMLFLWSRTVELICNNERLYPNARNQRTHIWTCNVMEMYKRESFIICGGILRRHQQHYTATVGK